MLRRRDKRSEARTSRRQNAQIFLEGGFARRECQLADISARGARIIIGRGQDLPKQFSLATSPDARPRKCQVVWRNQTMAGVKFI